MSPHVRLFLAAVAAAALIAGCGGSSAPQADTTPSGTSTTPPVTSVPDDQGPPPAQLTDGVYTGALDAFTFRPDPAWESADVGGEVYFATNRARTDTITIVSESLEGAPSDLDDYVTISLETAPDEIDGFKMLSRRTVTLPSGDRAQRLEFTGSLEGSPLMHFLMFVTLSDANAVTVTFAAPQTRYGKVVGAIEPILRTVDVN